MANINDIGDWKIGNYINDFGEKTGEHFIYKTEIGEFSNSATAGSKLVVTIRVNWSKYYSRPNIEISCDEYGNGVEDDIYCGMRWKVICKETRKVYEGASGTLTEVKDGKRGSSTTLEDLFKDEKVYEFNVVQLYNAKYHYTINTKGYNNALLKAGIISFDDL